MGNVGNNLTAAKKQAQANADFFGVPYYVVSTTIGLYVQRDKPTEILPVFTAQPKEPDMTGMSYNPQSYKVKWEIDIFDAVSFEDAARKALAIMRRRNSIATVFDVSYRDGPMQGCKHVDLTYPEETT